MPVPLSGMPALRRCKAVQAEALIDVPAGPQESDDLGPAVATPGPPGTTTAVAAAGDPVTPAAGPVVDEQVWIAVRRRDVQMHQLGDGRTRCGRSTRTGVTMPAGEAIERHQARPCRRCWQEE